MDVVCVKIVGQVPGGGGNAMLHRLYWSRKKLVGDPHCSRSTDAHQMDFWKTRTDAGMEEVDLGKCVCRCERMIAWSWELTILHISWRESSINAVVLANAVRILESEGMGEGANKWRSCTTTAISSSCLDRAIEMAAEDARASRVSDWTVTASSCAKEAATVKVRVWRTEMLATNKVDSSMCAAKVASSVFMLVMYSIWRSCCATQQSSFSHWRECIIWSKDEYDGLGAGMTVIAGTSEGAVPGVEEKISVGTQRGLGSKMNPWK